MFKIPIVVLYYYINIFLIMDTPKSISSIITGRSSLKNWLYKHYPEFYQYLIDKYNINDFKAMVYMYYNGIDDVPKCVVCGKPVKFHGHAYGFSKYCCSKCARESKESIEKYKATNIKRYGEDYSKVISKKVNETKLKRYGKSGYNNPEKNKETCLDRYGVDNPMKNKIIQEKAKQTCLDRYGVETYLKSDDYLNKKQYYIEKAKQTCLDRYGVINPMQLDEYKKKVNETCLDRYGVKWNCMREEAHNSRNSNSKPNEYIKKILIANNINFEREIVIGNYVYDFKIRNILLEINPYSTHNINWNPYGGKIIDKDYHLLKTQSATSLGYRVINICDWDDINKIISSICEKETIYARKCEIRLVPKKEAKEFLDLYHFQNSCNGQKIILGLYYSGTLVQIMTFGKPRYNKKHQWELHRLCTHHKYIIVGGIKKLFKYFINNYNPSSIISYCDNSKFKGDIYKDLGFVLKSSGLPSKHWYNDRLKLHITDNLLRQRGFDQLFKTKYGKGTSNEQLMRDNKFVEIYDAGQSVWVWNK